jgi:hypothetical protein
MENVKSPHLVGSPSQIELPLYVTPGLPTS